MKIDLGSAGIVHIDGTPTILLLRRIGDSPFKSLYTQMWHVSPNKEKDSLVLIPDTSQLAWRAIEATIRLYVSQHPNVIIGHTYTSPYSKGVP